MFFVYRTFLTSYLTTDEEPVQQSPLRGLMAAARSHCSGAAIPKFWKSDIRRSLATLDGGSEMAKAACWLDLASDSFKGPTFSAVIPSRMTTSCDGSLVSVWEKRGAGLLPYFTMWLIAASESTELGMSRRSLA